MLIASALIMMAFIVWNAMACKHAVAMTHFVKAGTATAAPEELSLCSKFRTLLFGVRLVRPVNAYTPDAFDLPYASLSITHGQDVTLSAWHIAATDADTLVILLHGYCASKSALLDEAAAFHSLGCDCLLIDFPGSGESTGNQTTIGYREAHDVVAVLRYARQHYPGRKIILFGQSMGAAAILRSISCLGADPDAIILEAVFDTMLQTVKNRFNSMGVPSFPSAHLLTFWGGVVMGTNGFKHNPVYFAHDVRVPALVLHGSHDMRARLEDGQRVFDALPCTKHMHVFDGVKHESFLSAQPEAWREQARRFIQDLRESG